MLEWYEDNAEYEDTISLGVTQAKHKLAVMRDILPLVQAISCVVLLFCQISFDR